MFVTGPVASVEIEKKFINDSSMVISSVSVVAFYFPDDRIEYSTSYKILGSLFYLLLE